MGINDSVVHCNYFFSIHTKNTQNGSRRARMTLSKLVLQHGKKCMQVINGVNHTRQSLTVTCEPPDIETQCYLRC